MTKRVGVFGLTSNQNVGDYLLVEATSHLLRLCDGDLDLVVIDADPQARSSYPGRRRLNLKSFQILRRRSNQIFKVIPNERFKYAYRYVYWWLKVNWHYRNSIKELDALVIAGGGFIKFKTQGLNFFVEQLIAIARRRSIPVMFNAVGIEGYDESDIRCRRLKKSLNASVVRVITTRDDISTLVDSYIVSPEIVNAQVGDPVFWLDSMSPEFARRPKEERLIGINLINPKNFFTYGAGLSQEVVANFYCNLLEELDRKGAKYELFSNGMLVDQKFGKYLVASMNLPKEILAPRPRSSTELLELFTRYEVILAARMHAGITAYSLGVPLVGLIWSEKIEHFSSNAGLRHVFFDQGELEAQKVAALLTDVNQIGWHDELRITARQNTRTYLEQFIASL
jgi:polysaccharide pyruvyl transferase WcaK-like protein